MVGWVKEDEKDMNLTIKYGNVRPLTNDTRNIYVTKVMETPVERMQKIMAEVLRNVSYKDIAVVKMEHYQVEQEAIAHLLYSLAGAEQWENLPYASSFKFELRVNNHCVAQSTNTSDDSYCFKVRIKYNGDFVDFRRQKLFHAREHDQPNGNQALIDHNE